jgi:hypothetical protein
LSQGIYKVVVSAGVCSDTFSVAINDVNGPTISVNSTDVSCNGGTSGSASVSVLGGTAPFTYSWSTGSSDTAVSNLSAGTYSITVSDKIGCKSSSVVTITEPAPMFLAMPSTTDASCDASCDGQAQVMPTGDINS